MFSLASLCVNNGLNDKVGPSKINYAGVGLDILSGIALLVIGSLVASGIMTMSPAASYAMIALGASQLSPFLIVATAVAGLTAKKYMPSCCEAKTKGYEQIR